MSVETVGLDTCQLAQPVSKRLILQTERLCTVSNLALFSAITFPVNIKLLQRATHTIRSSVFYVLVRMVTELIFIHVYPKHL